MRTLLLLFATLSSQAAVLYTVTTVTPAGAQALGLSNNGNVSGFTFAGDVTRYSGGVIQNLGQGPGAQISYGHGINDAGQVAGQQGAGSPVAIYYNGSSWSDLSPVVGTNSYGWDINNSGALVGSAGSTAFLYQGGVNTVLPMMTAWAINDAGVIVGRRNNGGSDMAVIRSAGGILTDIGTLTGFSSRALAVSETGDLAAGLFFTNGVSGTLTNAFAYSPGGGAVAIGGLGGNYSDARGVNSAGVVVGAANLSSGLFRAFIYDSANGMRNLNTLIDPLSGITLTNAYGINDAGQIIANGTFAGQNYGFLLTPVSTVPEPGTWAVCGLGLVLLSRRLRRR